MVPSLSRSLWAAAKASPTSGSMVGAVSISGNQIESKPNSHQRIDHAGQPRSVAHRGRAQSHADADLHRRRRRWPALTVVG